jgi:hypothetical protein
MFNKIRHSFRRKAIKLCLRLIGLLLEALSVSLALYWILVLVKPPEQVGVVQGNVLLGTDPVEGVTMTLVKDGATAASTLTDAAGQFEFDPIAVGTYLLQAIKDVPEGHLEGSVDIEVDGDGVTVADLPLVKSHLWCEPGTR